MTDLKEYTAFDCEQCCPFDDDCRYPDPRCPVKRKSHERKGEPLPKISAYAPQDHEGRGDYLRQYMRNYRRVSIKGIKLNREDMEILKRYFDGRGEVLEEEVAKILEAQAERIREKVKS